MHTHLIVDRCVFVNWLLRNLQVSHLLLFLDRFFYLEMLSESHAPFEQRFEIAFTQHFKIGQVFQNDLVGQREFAPAVHWSIRSLELHDETYVSSSGVSNVI